jgi:hypothetical protein
MSTLMRAFRICGCCLLLALLHSSLGCNGSGLLKAPPKDRHLTISGNPPHCAVSPKWRWVHKGDTLFWDDPQNVHTYTIDFGQYSPFPTSTPALATGYLVTGGSRCPDPNHPTSSSDCYFSYALSGDGKPCLDPGIHVIPNTLFSIFSKSE